MAERISVFVASSFGRVSTFWSISSVLFFNPFTTAFADISSLCEIAKQKDNIILMIIRVLQNKKIEIPYIISFQPFEVTITECSNQNKKSQQHSNVVTR